MSSSSTLRRATPDEVFAGLLVEREVVDAEFVDDIRAALMDESGGGNIIEALIDSEVLPLETAELIADELERGILTCPGCPGRFNVGSLARGARFKCKTCGTAVTVPAIPITREVLGRFGWSEDGGHGGDDVSLEELDALGDFGADDDDLGDLGDLDINVGDALPAAAPMIEESKLKVTSDADAIEAAMAVGTAEDQLLDFTDVDVSEEPAFEAAPKPRPKRSRPARSSRRSAASRTDDDDVDEDDEFLLEDEGPKPKPALMMWMVWVVIPVVMCAVVMYYTAEIKMWMFGAPENDDGGYYQSGGGSRRVDDGTGDYKPSIKAEECDDWMAAAAAADAAVALVGQARDAASAGDTASAKAKFAEAGDKFQEAYELWDEVAVAYGKHCEHLQPTVDGWVKTHEAADEEAAKLR
ncbi:MAG: hypothetical protein ACYTGX_00175 [Planctomycetota bacterium]|jgi:hypothetical protein